MQESWRAGTHSWRVRERMDVVERRGERSTAVPRWRPDPVAALRFAWMPFRSPSPRTPRTHRPVSGSDRNTRAKCPRAGTTGASSASGTTSASSCWPPAHQSTRRARRRRRSWPRSARATTGSARSTAPCASCRRSTPRTSAAGSPSWLGGREGVSGGLGLQPGDGRAPPARWPRHLSQGVQSMATASRPYAAPFLSGRSCRTSAIFQTQTKYWRGPHTLGGFLRGDHPF